MQAHCRLDAVVLPRNFERIGVRLALNARRTDQSGQSARRIGSSGKSDNVNFIAGGKIGDHETVAFLYNLLEPETDGSAQDLLKKSPSVPTPS